MSTAGVGEYFAYVGTYTRRSSEGIYVYRLDASTGELRDGRLAAAVEDPSFVAIAPGAGFLYAVGEGGKPVGTASAYAIDPTTGSLRLLNQQPTGGPGPCHLTVDATGRMLIATNYAGGSVAAFPIGHDGRLGERSEFIQHEGSSVTAGRQDAPHAHSVNLDAVNGRAFVADLGLDRVMLYELDSGTARLRPADPPWASFAPGSGPRHFAWHPAGDERRRFAYVINELDSTITACSYDSGRGTLTKLQTVPALPADFADPSSCADIHVLPSGAFVYGSNRGHDSIVIYRIDPDGGTLTYVGHEPTQGRNPRNFAITPGGGFLLAANQDSDTIVTFAIDAETGTLRPTGAVAEAPMPVCLKFVRAA